MGAYLRWALIRGWALIRINTVFTTAGSVGRVVFSETRSGEVKYLPLATDTVVNN